jgi:serine phosphatase RsbU (regulator of sigma subunit)
MQSILGDCFILLRPQEIVSGDFYWAIQKDNNTLLAVADCTGHGVPGAFMSVLGLSLLNKIVNEASCCKPETILNKLRDEVKDSLRQTGKIDEAKDGMDMALIQFNRNSLELHFAGANNPAFIVRDEELIVLKENRMPIGIYPKEREFDGQSINLKKNDMIYLFSDGYIDQFGGTSYRKFMMKNFKQTLLSISKLPLGEQQQILDATMNDWKGENHQNDDILVVGVRV